jgi:ANTAR domain
VGRLSQPCHRRSGKAWTNCTADQALEILRVASQNRNVKFRHVAADIITGLTGQPPQPPPFWPPG